MLLRNIILATSSLGLVGCGNVQQNLTDGRPTGSGAVPPPQALGVFRHVCLDSDPKEKLQFPFSQENQNTFKHADFDLRFEVSGQSCSMIFKVKEHTGKNSAETGNRGERSATERVLEGFANMNPKIQTKSRDDGYVTATIQQN